MKVKPRNGEKLSVLVVEDEPELRQTLKEFLETTKCFSFIIEARDGQDGYVRYQNQEFDLIITDLMMPKANGLELVINISKQEQKKKKKTPLLILSGNLTSLEVKKSINLGVKYLLAKPCTLEKFTEKVHEILIKNHRKKIKVLES